MGRLAEVRITAEEREVLERWASRTTGGVYLSGSTPMR